MSKRFVIGSRRSALALWQANYVRELLQAAHPTLAVEIKEIITTGDKIQNKTLPEIGGKGIFTAELEEELRNGTIDIAQHSLKDLPTQMDSDFVLGAICERGPVCDVLISKNREPLADLPAGAVIGTSSLRRSSQLRRLRPDLKIESIRGNVDTRIAKLFNPELNYSAIVLAQAGVTRMGRDSEISQVFSYEEMMPAPGQGAVALQCMARNKAVLDIISPLNSYQTQVETEAERAFLEALDAGCRMPVAAIAEFEQGKIVMSGRGLSPDGTQCVEVQGEEVAVKAAELGRRLAEEALRQGFRLLTS